MERLITVRGAGRISLAPDTVTLHLTLNGQDPAYAQALERAESALAALRQALSRAGFAPEALKTQSFRVEPVYDSVRNDKGDFVTALTGYRCQYDLCLTLPLVPERLGAAIDAATAGPAAPELQLEFSLEDQDQAQGQALAAAAKDAARRAALLCEASGVKLGALVRVDADPMAGPPVSPTAVNLPGLRLAKRSQLPELTALDICVEAEAQFTWPISE